MPATISKKTSNTEYIEGIHRLKKEKGAVLLAHYYQEPAIQDIADFVGDSLGLSQEASKTDAKMIVFAGVRFMAETAKILNPTKKVVLPDFDASCSLAESCLPESFKAFVDAHPNHVVISYVNCSAEIKAMSDIICTSSNAKKIIETIPKETPIIFAPDKNLGSYLIKETKRDMVLWDGVCIVHEAFDKDKLLKLHHQHPGAKFIAHPESSADILQLSSFIGSTTALIDYVKHDAADTFIVGTEEAILHQMQKKAPHKKLIPAPITEDNTCACSECFYMKMNTLEKLYWCMKNEKPEIVLDPILQKKALIPLQRMLEISSS